MYEQIEKTVRILLTTYLIEKFDVPKLLAYVDQNPTLTTTLFTELDLAIEQFNALKKTGFPKYLTNSIQLSQNFSQELPRLCTLELTPKLVANIGTQLRDDPYFVAIWRIPNSTDLLCNILMLIYRNYMLTTYASELLNPDGSRRVQISSSIEEVIFQLQIDGKPTLAAKAFSCWLTDWEDEGFTQELYERVARSTIH